MFLVAGCRKVALCVVSSKICNRILMVDSHMKLEAPLPCPTPVHGVFWGL